MSQDEQYYAEKRDFIRMFIDAPVDFALEGTDTWYQGLGNDLSGGGLSFTTSHELSEGDRINVKLHPVTPVTPAFEALVSVIRSEKSDSDSDSDSDNFSVSTKIEAISR